MPAASKVTGGSPYAARPAQLTFVNGPGLVPRTGTREMLRQRDDRITLGQDAKRIAQSKRVEDAHRVGPRDLRTAKTIRRTRGLKTSMATPQNPGHIKLRTSRGGSLQADPVGLNRFRWQSSGLERVNVQEIAGEREAPRQPSCRWATSWQLGPITGRRGYCHVAQILGMTWINDGGRGRYRTADRWCVKPEISVEWRPASSHLRTSEDIRRLSASQP